jgi:cytoskeletal protein CcmA (bactofilin family)
MFGRKKKRPAMTIHTLVGAETRVQGDLQFVGGCHVDGYVKGNVKAHGDGPALLSVSEHGCVEGSVSAPHVILSGTVKGDVRASERVELGETARVVGNVHYQLIEMAIGAEINGKLIHEGSPRAPEPAADETGESAGEVQGADEIPSAPR